MNKEVWIIGVDPPCPRCDLTRQRVERLAKDMDIIDGPAKHWSPEFDDALRPCQEKADSVDILMTPIVVVEKEVKHHGSVPSIEQLQSWLS